MQSVFNIFAWFIIMDKGKQLAFPSQGGYFTLFYPDFWITFSNNPFCLQYDSLHGVSSMLLNICYFWQLISKIYNHRVRKRALWYTFIPDLSLNWSSLFMQIYFPVSISGPSKVGVEFLLSQMLYFLWNLQEFFISCFATKYCSGSPLWK